MKILFDLQLSFIDKKTGKFKLDCDSNFNFTKNVILGFKQLDKDIQIGLILPDKETSECDAEFYSNLENIVDLFFVKYPSNFITSRFIFPFYELKDVINKYQPDFMWTNDFCRVPMYKCVINELNYEFKIIAYNHWIDNFMYPKVDANYTYFFSQIDGAFKADYILFNTQRGIDIFVEGLEDKFNYDFCWQISSKSYIVNPAFDFNVLKDINRNKFKFNTKTILFNHRLSTLFYYKSNFKYLRQMCDRLQNIYKFDVILTNPSGYIYSDLPSYMKSVNVPDYLEYLSLISSCDICVGFFFDSPGTWSMSLAEAAAIGIPLVLPNKSGYKEIVPCNYEFLADSFEDAVKKVEELLLLNSQERKDIGKKLSLYAYNTYSPVNAIKSFYEVME